MKKWRYIRDAIMWIACAATAIYCVNKTGNIDSLTVFVMPIATTLFGELFNLAQ